jgi:hypothetical protein
MITPLLGGELSKIMALSNLFLIAAVPSLLIIGLLFVLSNKFAPTQ